MKRPRVGRWIRWKYVLPRLAALAVVAAAVRYGLDPALKWAAITGGQSALGAKLEIAELSTELRRGQLHVKGLAAANPHKPMRNLVEAEALDLQLDAGALLRKRFVVRDGVARGLKFDSTRTESGALPDQPPASEEDATPAWYAPLAAAAVEQGSAWLGNVGTQVQDDLMAELKSPQLADELEQRWPATLAELERRADDLQAQGKQLEREFREVKSNPLRHVDRLPQLQASLTQAAHEAQQLAARVQQLPQEADRDRQALDAARRHDEQVLRRQLSVDALDGDQLTAYLLGEQADGYLRTAIDGLRAARRLVPSNKTEVTAPNRRGTEISFVRQPRPEMLIERLRLEGEARLGGQSWALSGELTDLASQPELHGAPAQLKFTGAGAFPLEVCVRMDRRGDEPIDEFTLSCPHIELAERSLGSAEKLAVAIPASTAQLTAEVRLVGEQLSGTIVLRQSELRLATSSRGVKDAALAEAIAQSMSRIDGFDATVTLAGDLERPRWTLASDLGPQVAEGMREAVTGYLTVRRDRLAAKMQAELDEQVAQWDRQRQAAEQKLLAKLQQHQQLFAALAPLAGQGEFGGAAAALPALGKALGEGLLKR